ncbi:uncharacterized protein LOC111393074 [Olea europaea var. sylvestris]|uniref:uncharacterized protein LOC111393074 n=1 Tax=Olea europaea var. sylvestris TaxID=158386 RepID=UPI000C1D7E4E|nr:uncharacterized protein LOC111393074 [Olea europaea var. sylvestris]
MLQLFLCELKWIDGNGSDESATKRKSLLSELESLIQSLMSSGGQSQARLWLCNTLSGIRSIGPRCQRELQPRMQHNFCKLIFDKQPRKVGPIIAKKSYMLEKFCSGKSTSHPENSLCLGIKSFEIQFYFHVIISGNPSSGGFEHGKGAKAVSQFAFVNWDLCWGELVWKGKHGQSPATVATEPRYFLDLDVQRTVENFLDYVPKFSE